MSSFERSSNCRNWR